MIDPATGEPMVRVAAVELRRVTMPMRAPFVARHGPGAARDLVVVRVLTGNGDGWGECVAMAEPTYSEEYVDGAHQVLRAHLVPRLLAGPNLPLTPSVAAARLASVQGHRMAKAALLDAVLDAALRAEARSLADHLGARRRRVPAGIALGIEPDVDALVARVAEAVAEGYQRVKLKWSPRQGYDALVAVRDAFPHLALQLDANEAWAAEPDLDVEAYDDLGLLFYEQPFDRDDIDAHVRLATRSRTPICLDESLTTVELALHLTDVGACSVLCVKPGRVGGVLAAQRLHDGAAARGRGAWVGGMFETGLGKAANLAVAALDGFTHTGDVSASSRFWDDDLTDPHVVVDGHVAVPDGPGLGVVPRPDVLARVTTDIELLRP